MSIFLALYRNVTKACHYRVRCVAGNVVLFLRGRRQTSRTTNRDPIFYDPTNPLHRRAFQQFTQQRRAHIRAQRHNKTRRRDETSLRGAEAFLATDMERERAKRRHPSNTTPIADPCTGLDNLTTIYRYRPWDN